MSPSFWFYGCAVGNSKGQFYMNVFVAPQIVARLAKPLFVMGVFPFHMAEN